VRLYISGPMTGLPDLNFPAFHRAEERLAAGGFEVVNPARMGEVPGWKLRDYLKRDIPELLECDGVATLTDLTLSRGRWAEVTVALAVGMPVRPVEEWLGEEISPDGGNSGVEPQLECVESKRSEQQGG